MGSASLLRLVAIGIVVALFGIAFLPARAIAADPLIFRRDIHSPPATTERVEPQEGKDIFTPGSPPKVKGWLVNRYHWDDGNGNDLTVDTICMLDAKVEYYSLRITQSKNGRETLVAAPGGGRGLVDPSACCPYLNGSDVGPLFELPDSAIGNSEQLPRLITFISKNPHLPGKRDNLPRENYKKTLVWMIPGRAIKGTIKEDISGNLSFDGEFSTPRSPNGKSAKQLDEVEKDNLRSLLNDEKLKADDLERRRFPTLEKAKAQLNKKHK